MSEHRAVKVMTEGEVFWQNRVEIELDRASPNVQGHQLYDFDCEAGSHFLQ